MINRIQLSGSGALLTSALAVALCPTSAHAQRRRPTVLCSANGVRQNDGCICNEGYHTVFVPRRNVVTCAPLQGDANQCGAPRHISDGHCCGPGEEWVAARNQCMCVDPNGCSPGGGGQGPSVAVTHGVSVRFEGSRSGDDYNVSVTTEGGTRSCPVPCELILSPGFHDASITGAATYRTSLAVPQQGPVRVLVHRRRTASLVWGIIDISLGVPLTIAGGVATVVMTRGFQSDANGYELLSAGMFALGLTAVIVGSVAVAGRDANRLEVAPRAFAARSSGPRLLGLGVGPMAEGFGGGAAFSF